eukprot:1195337-Prorocentrum_minimum.AAC.1
MHSTPRRSFPFLTLCPIPHVPPPLSPSALLAHASLSTDANKSTTSLGARSADGRKLVVSSSDGYCSVVLFDAHELGELAPLSEVPEHVMRIVRPPALHPRAPSA